MNNNLTDKEIIEMLEKRLKHLLKSELISRYDELDPFTHKYKLDIKEFDKIYNKELINMKNKIPFLCKIKNKINLSRSPSALFMCEYGFQYRNINKCMNCPKKIGIDFGFKNDNE